jgi:7,8-dihydropterin-6-yl-methyl-4-(beta-D-ribofuranosyl)aminobenzene 5'-phosphate synthase
MKISRFLTLILLVGSLQFQLTAQDYKYLDNQQGLSRVTASNGIEKPVTVKVIYDNYAKVDGVESDWGYSIVIEGLDKNVLFDTGTNPDIFGSNFQKMKIDPSTIDLVIISHEHGDHTVGIDYIAGMRKNIPVVIPHSFSDSFKKKMVNFGFIPILADGPSSICDHLYTSGEFSYQIPEQALILNTKKGLVVMTGCSYPGIVKMLMQIKSDFNKNIYMVFGGFHLLDKSEKEMKTIISEIKNIGIVKCGATHCTGESQIKMFREAFGEDYFELGVGNTLIIN